MRCLIISSDIYISVGWSWGRNVGDEEGEILYCIG
jgi:hypothetical protein